MAGRGRVSKNPGSENTLVIIAVILVIVSGVGLILTWTNVFAFDRILLQPTDTGTARVLIAQQAAIRFAHDDLDWGSGFVTPLATAELNTLSGVATDFSGTVLSQGFLVENSGNVAVILDIESDIGAAAFLSGATAPVFEYQVNNCFEAAGPYACTGSPNQLLNDLPDTDPTGACDDTAVRDPLTVGMWAGFVPMPVNPSSDRICGIAVTGGMDFGPLEDELEINIRLTFDDQITSGTKGPATITVTASQV